MVSVNDNGASDIQCHQQCLIVQVSFITRTAHFQAVIIAGTELKKEQELIRR